jgi:hypothetical protein
MENKPTFFLNLMVSGTSFISKKIRTRILTKKHTLWIRRKIIPDPGGKKAPDPGSGGGILEGTMKSPLVDPSRLGTLYSMYL